MDVVAQVARSLESGRGGPLSRAAGKVWGACAERSLVKRLELPARTRAIVVGGATLGGSGKTPLAIACAKYLASLGERTAFIGHAYGAAPPGPVVVSSRDHLRSVGDEALVAAEALAATGVPVVVAPTRRGAVDLAITQLGARVLVIDGLAQIAPRRADLALLALDARQPWGAGACPPQGDLRASRGALVDACDCVVTVGDSSTSRHDLAGLGRPVHDARRVAEGAWQQGRRVSWNDLRGSRVGLFTALARPNRVLSMLATAGVVPVFTASVADHGRGLTSGGSARGRAARETDIDVWLCTRKCAVHFPPRWDARLVALLDDLLVLDPELERALRGAVGR